ncbi:MAG: Cytochrome c551 peroxidase precursor [Deltaproteobacteria bacterium ADurb.Bin058]|nr:MAG: Cytochrome c551 peroxidase precursor [Deltaproteobacteria bacterium ADurb.Bin058]
MKKLVMLVALGIVAYVGMGIVNIIFGTPKDTALSRNAVDDPGFHKVALALERSCMNCHSSETKMPFYAAIPGAGHIIRYDIEMGREYLDITAEMNGGGGAKVSEVALAKTEWVVQNGTMPPIQYLALHWDGALSSKEKQNLYNWIAKTRVAQFSPKGMDPAIAGAVVRPLRQVIPTDPAKVALGERLYHDKRLSADNTVSCATCHPLDKGGVDGTPTSKGIRDQWGPINAPTVYNAALNFAQFWNGRAATLEDQADGPPNDPKEMGSNWPEIVEKLNQDQEFVDQFTRVYPAGFSKETITHAIAEYERTLLTPNAPFDRYLAGDENAITADQKAGWQLFTKLGCSMCHVGEILGGQSYEMLGRKADYFKDRGTPITEADLGRYNVTKDETERYHQKVPMLRNIAQTAPYMHDATAPDLKIAVDFMAKYELGITIKPKDNELIVTFLNSLTGEFQGKPLQ